MNISELRQLTPKKLYVLLRETRRALAIARFHLKTGQTTDSARVGALRKTIARVLTFLNTSSQ